MSGLREQITVDLRRGHPAGRGDPGHRAAGGGHGHHRRRGRAPDVTRLDGPVGQPGRRQRRDHGRAVDSAVGPRSARSRPRSTPSCPRSAPRRPRSPMHRRKLDDDQRQASTAGITIGAAGHDHPVRLSGAAQRAAVQAGSSLGGRGGPSQRPWPRRSPGPLCSWLSLLTLMALPAARRPRRPGQRRTGRGSWSTTTAARPPTTASSRTRTYRHIQDALDAARPGDRISVCPGRYPESLRIGPRGDDVYLATEVSFEAVAGTGTHGPPAGRRYPRCQPLRDARLHRPSGGAHRAGDHRRAEHPRYTSLLARARGHPDPDSTDVTIRGDRIGAAPHAAIARASTWLAPAPSSATTRSPTSWPRGHSRMRARAWIVDRTAVRFLHTRRDRGRCPGASLDAEATGIAIDGAARAGSVASASSRACPMPRTSCRPCCGPASTSPIPPARSASGAAASSRAPGDTASGSGGPAWWPSSTPSYATASATATSLTRCTAGGSSAATANGIPPASVWVRTPMT